MKRTLSLLLTLMLVLSLTFALASCGETPVKTTVTAEEFETAVNYDGSCTMILTSASQTEGKTEMTIKLSDTKLEYDIKITDPEGEVESVVMFFEFLEDVTYMYMSQTDEDGAITGYIKMASEATLEELMEEMSSSYIPEDLMDFDAYTYDETSKTYKLASATIEMYGEEFELKDVELAFADGKMVSMAYKMGEDEDMTTCTITCDYTAPTITIPTENVTDMTDMAG